MKLTMSQALKQSKNAAARWLQILALQECMEVVCTIKCAYCTKKVTATTTTVDVSDLPETLRDEGWRSTKKGAICPRCLKKKKPNR